MANFTNYFLKNGIALFSQMEERQEGKTDQVTRPKIDLLP